MLCRNPYLYAPPNENDADKARRNRLIKETDSLKVQAMDKYVTPTPAKKKSSAGTGQ
jgi:hypothetical protein